MECYMSRSVKTVALLSLLCGALVNAQDTFKGAAHVSFTASSSGSIDNFKVSNTTCFTKFQASKGGQTLDTTFDSLAFVQIGALSVSGSAEAFVSFSKGGTDNAVMVNVSDTAVASGYITKTGSDSQVISIKFGSNVEFTKSNDTKRLVCTRSDNDAAVVLMLLSSLRGSLSSEDSQTATIQVEDGTRIAMRSYANDRSGGDDGDDEIQEQFITNGTTTADMDVATDSNGQFRLAAQPFYSDVTVSNAVATESSIEFDITKNSDDGDHVIIKLSDAVSAVSNVRIDGTAATKVSSYSELAASGSSSKYLVRNRNSNQVDLIVHFGTSSSTTGLLNQQETRSVTVESSSEDSGARSIVNKLAISLLAPMLAIV